MRDEWKQSTPPRQLRAAANLPAPAARIILEVPRWRANFPVVFFRAECLTLSHCPPGGSRSATFADQRNLRHFCALERKSKSKQPAIAAQTLLRKNTYYLYSFNLFCSCLRY